MLSFSFELGPYRIAKYILLGHTKKEIVKDLMPKHHIDGQKRVQLGEVWRVSEWLKSDKHPKLRQGLGAISLVAKDGGDNCLRQKYLPCFIWVAKSSTLDLLNRERNWFSTASNSRCRRNRARYWQKRVWSGGFGLLKEIRKGSLVSGEFIRGQEMWIPTQRRLFKSLSSRI